ncbi:hypothetical protein RPALISO_134 [Ruegeria phage RpAliso]|nr:hypothetical protein RPALISO_134 [Ruegeria phage RpAliso]
MTKNIDTIISKIQKLRARAADDASSEAEAAHAITVAERLMRSNNLTEAVVRDGIKKKTIAVVTDEWSKGTKTLPIVELLAIPIMHLTQTRAWIRTARSGVKSINYIGLPQDVEYALYLTDLCHEAMEQAWKRLLATETIQAMPSKSRPAYRRSFQRGMVATLRQRMMDLAAENAQNVESTALVVCKRGLIEEAMKQEGLDNMRARKTRKKTVGADAYYRGRAAGDKVALTTGIGN